MPVVTCEKPGIQTSVRVLVAVEETTDSRNREHLTVVGDD
jgi:hypothetical protein